MDTNGIAKLKKLIKTDIPCMLVCQNEYGEMCSRPMMIQEIDQEGNAWFFASKLSEKTSHLIHHPDVHLDYSSPSDSTYLSIQGRAEFVDDNFKKEQLWTPLAKTWFSQGPSDPNLTLIKVKISHAEYWDAPYGKMVEFFTILKSAITHKKYGMDADKHGEIDIKAS